MRILILTIEIPFPPVGGARLRTYQFIEALMHKHELTVVGFTHGEPLHSTDLQLTVVSIPWESPRLYQEMQSADLCVSQAAFAKLQTQPDEPWIVSYYESSLMAETLRGMSQAVKFDLVLFKDSIMARYLPVLPESIPKALDFQDVLTRLAQRNIDGKFGGELELAVWEANRMRQFEQRAASQCVLTFACSEQEAVAAEELLGIDGIEVIPNEVDTEFFSPSETEPISGCLVFTGTMNYAPNIEAMQYFTRDVLPIIRQVSHDNKLHIVGKSPSKEVFRLASEYILVLGSVPDMRPYYRDAEVVIVPILQGGGTRRKILEAAACGKAIVTTSLGVEGLEFMAGEDVIVADSAADFADAVLALTNDKAKRFELGQRARKAALRYDSERIAAFIRKAIEEIEIRAINKII